MPSRKEKPTRDSLALVSAVEAFNKLAMETEDPVVALIKLMQSKRLSAADQKRASLTRSLTLNILYLFLHLGCRKLEGMRNLMK
jgi:CRP-like cAMP-binding protein